MATWSTGMAAAASARATGAGTLLLADAAGARQAKSATAINTLKGGFRRAIMSGT